MRKSINLIESHEIIAEAGAGPSRINTHIQNGDPFFVISACQADLSTEDNAKRTNVLKSALAKAPGASFIPISGQFHEAGKTQPSINDSFFVLQRSKSNPKKFIAFGEKLMGLFDQEAIIYGDGSQIFLKAAGEEPMILGNAVSFRAEISDTVGAVKGRSFSVVGNDYNATGYGHGKKKIA